MSEILDKYLVVIFSTIIGALTWLVRTVLTNQKKIELLEGEIKSRNHLREEDREMLQTLVQDVKEVKRDILSIYRDNLKYK